MRDIKCSCGKCGLRDPPLPPPAAAAGLVVCTSEGGGEDRGRGGRTWPGSDCWQLLQSCPATGQELHNAMDSIMAGRRGVRYSWLENVGMKSWAAKKLELRIRINFFSDPDESGSGSDRWMILKLFT